MAKTTDEDLRSYLTALGAVGYFNDEHDNFTFILNDGTHITAEAYANRAERRFRIRENMTKEERKTFEKLPMSEVVKKFSTGELSEELNAYYNDMGNVLGEKGTCRGLIELYTLGEIPRKFPESKTVKGWVTEEKNEYDKLYKKGISDILLRARSNHTGKIIRQYAREYVDETFPGISKSERSRLIHNLYNGANNKMPKSKKKK